MNEIEVIDMKTILIFAVLVSFNVHATWIKPGDIKAIPKQPEFPSASVLSKSKSNMASQISEQEFKSVISKIQTTYAPIVKKIGGKLSITGSWKKNNVFAGATQQFGTWKVKFSGGLARRPELTSDGMTLILCHELGHHIGGYAFASPSTPLSGSWAANEGQADYFSTHVCAKKMWENELERNAEFRRVASKENQSRCEIVWKDSNQKDLCYRILTAIESMTKTMAALKEEKVPSFETPSALSVSAVDDGHPSTQCRMDTTLQGALCAAPFDDNLIPGKRFPRRFENSEAEKEAALNSCTQLTGYTIGLRPTCWYKARY